MMAPSTATIKVASGKNEVSSIQATWKNGTDTSDFGSFGASDGLMMARAIT